MSIKPGFQHPRTNPTPSHAANPVALGRVLARQPVPPTPRCCRERPAPHAVARHATNMAGRLTCLVGGPRIWVRATPAPSETRGRCPSTDDECPESKRAILRKRAFMVPSTQFRSAEGLRAPIGSATEAAKALGTRSLFCASANPLDHPVASSLPACSYVALHR